MNESWLVWGMIFGAVGFGCFIYGRKQKSPVPFFCGLALMSLPYFVSSTTYLLLCGLALLLACYFIKI